MKLANINLRASDLSSVIDNLQANQENPKPAMIATTNATFPTIGLPFGNAQGRILVGIQNRV